MAVNKVRVKVSGSIGKSVRVGGTSTTTTGGLTSAQVAQQIASAVAAIPAASGGSGTVTSVGITAGSADITVTGVSPITGSGSLAIDLSAGIKATVASALQTAGSTHLVVTGTAIDLAAGDKSTIASALQTAGSTHLVVTGTAIDLAAADKSTIASALQTAGSTHLVVTGTAIDLAAADKADIALAATAVQPGAIQNMESALWNSTSGAVQTALTVAQDILIPFACTLKEVDVLTQGPVGSCTVTILRGAASAGAISFPPATDITNGHNVACAAASVQILTATLASQGWTTSFGQNDVLRLTLTANTNFTSVKIILRMY